MPPPLTTEVVYSLSDPMGTEEGLLPTWLCRVRVDRGAMYTFKLTRQSGYDGTLAITPPQAAALAARPMPPGPQP